MADEGFAAGGIVLLEEEGLLLALLQRFPARRDPALFAATVAEAAAAFDVGQPRLLVAPVGDREGERLDELVGLLARAREADARVVGLCAAGARVGEALGTRVDRLVDPADAPAVLDVVAELLEERRARPRAQVAIPVTVNGVGRHLATVVSEHALFLPSDRPLGEGRVVTIALEDKGRVLRGWARVLRVGPSAPLGLGMVLEVADHEHTLRAYLGGLVRGALLLEHVEHASGRAPSTARGAGQLRQDVTLNRELLKSQATLVSALHDRVERLTVSEAQSLSWAEIKPLLARKIGAQQQQIERLLGRVDQLAAGQDLVDELRQALGGQLELQRCLLGQQAAIEALQHQLAGGREPRDGDSTLSGLGPVSGVEPSAAGDVAPAPGSTVVDPRAAPSLGEPVASLGEPVASTADTPAPALAAAALAGYGERIATAASRLGGLRDQLRSGLDGERLTELGPRLARDQRALRDHLDSLRNDEWTPLPNVFGYLEETSDARVAREPGVDVREPGVAGAERVRQDDVATGEISVCHAVPEPAIEQSGEVLVDRWLFDDAPTWIKRSAAAIFPPADELLFLPDPDDGQQPVDGRERSEVDQLPAHDTIREQRVPVEPLAGAAAEAPMAEASADDADVTGPRVTLHPPVALCLVPPIEGYADRAPVSADEARADVDGTDVDGTDVDGTDVDGTDVDGMDVDGMDGDGTDGDGTDGDGTDGDGTDVDGTDVDGTDVDGTPGEADERPSPPAVDRAGPAVDRAGPAVDRAGPAVEPAGPAVEPAGPTAELAESVSMAWMRIAGDDPRDDTANLDAPRAWRARVLASLALLAFALAVALLVTGGRVG